MSGEITESTNDVDLGSGGVMLLPDMTDTNGTVRQLAVGAGKDGNCTSSIETTWASSLRWGTTSGRNSRVS